MKSLALNRRNRRRNRTIEALEDRAMMAVTAGFKSGVLTITGDNDANSVTVTQTGLRAVHVDGLSSGIEDFTGVDSIVVNVKGGDDTVNIGESPDGTSPLELFKGLTIELGDGNDTANVFVNSLGDVKITSTAPNSLNDDDTVLVSHSIAKSLTVTLGVGNDTLTVEEVATLTLNANVGVPTLKPGQIDSDSVDVLNSAIGIANISVGTADESESSDDISGIVIGGQNNVLVDGNILGSLTITGGDKVENVTVSSEGTGIGPHVSEMLVSLAVDLETGIAAGAVPGVTITQIQQILTQLDGLLTRFVPEGVEIPTNIRNFLNGEASLSETLSALFEEELSFVTTIGDTTIILLSLTIDTKQDNDTIVVIDTLNLGTTTVNAGTGDDYVQIGEGGASPEDPREPIEVLKKVTIELGDGQDRGLVYLNTIADVVITSTPAAKSTNDDDFIVVGDSIMKSLTITTGVGSDEVIINQVAALTLNVNVGVASIRPDQTDSDAVSVLDSAFLTATISLGTADVSEGTGEGSGLLVFGQNTVVIDASILGKLTVTGGNRIDEVTISSEGAGIGPNIRPHLVDMVDDIENIIGPILTALAPTILTNLDTLLGTFVPEGIELPEIDLSEFDLSEALDEFLGGDDLGPVLESLGDNTLIVISANIDTKGDNDRVTVLDTLVLGGCKILTGDGSDNVVIARSQFLGVFPPFNPISNPPLVVQLGNGDDFLDIDSVFAVSFKFLGEGGTGDGYSQIGDNFLILGTRTGFEP